MQLALAGNDSMLVLVPDPPLTMRPAQETIDGLLIKKKLKFFHKRSLFSYQGWLLLLDVQAPNNDHLGSCQPCRWWLGLWQGGGDGSLR